MIYSNPEYFLLLAVTLGCFLVCSRYQARFYLLLFSSFVFYAWSGLLDTLLFYAVIVFSWLTSFAAYRYPRFKKHFVVSGVVVLLLHLFFWKYASWLVSEIQKLSPSFLNGRHLSLPLPVGISFFTLQGIAFLVDSYRVPIKISLGKFTLFKSFFPQLVAGPIVRSTELLPELETLDRPTHSNFSEGLTLFSIGLMKKMLVADKIAPFVDTLFANPSQYDRFTLMLGLIAYTCQIYADFSGYTDMGRGSALCLGIRLPENFRAPYFSKSPSEFWKRWHITLSQWIRDYLYIPLGGRRGSTLKTCAVVLVTMAIAGFWHGANWTFGLWGLFHGVLLVIERHTSLFRNSQWSAYLLTQICVMVGWLLFRCESMSTFVAYGSGFVWNGGQALTTGRVSVAIAIFATFVFHLLQYESLSSRLERLEPFLMRWPRVKGLLAGVGIALLIFLTLLFRPPVEAKPFIYFQF